MKLIKAISTATLSFAIIYLFGSFHEQAFNISKWSKDVLDAVSVLGGMIFFVISFFTYGHLTELEEKKPNNE